MDAAPTKPSTGADKFKLRVDTLGGRIGIEWDKHSPVTMHGHLAFFSEYLNAGGIFERFVSNCPLEYKSNNAPEVRDVLGTMVASILNGHRRYRHVDGLYGDAAIPELLSMKQMVSQDSARRAFINVDEEKIKEWINGEILHCCEPLLSEPYILDIDPTVKPLYGHQEGAEKGYNPHKHGRPSHCIHTYFVGSLRMVLGVEVRPGKETAGKYSHGELWNLLDNRLAGHLRPRVVRGDVGYGNEATMSGCESRGVDYLFKLRRSPKVVSLVDQLCRGNYSWKDAGQGWEGFDSTICLGGWSESRRVVVLRRQTKSSRDATSQKATKQKGAAVAFEEASLFAPELLPPDDTPEYEWAVLATSLDFDIPAVAQLYRDRGDCENVFDELKNQWGWGGFNTRDMKRSSLMARMVALAYNWWNVFCRLANPGRHMEAATSRPMLQQIVGRIVKRGGGRLMHMAVIGAMAEETRRVYENISLFLKTFSATATQLNPMERWSLILSKAFGVFLDGRRLSATSDGQQWLLPLS